MSKHLAPKQRQPGNSLRVCSDCASKRDLKQMYQNSHMFSSCKILVISTQEHIPETSNESRLTAICQIHIFRLFRPHEVYPKPQAKKRFLQLDKIQSFRIIQNTCTYI